MKIMITSCINKNLWYSSKIGKVYNATEERNSKYLTKDGEVDKEDAVIIEK